MKIDFSSPVATAGLSRCADVECRVLTASPFRILNSFAGIHRLSASQLCWPQCFRRPTWLHTPGCLALSGRPRRCGCLARRGHFCAALCRRFLFLSLLDLASYQVLTLLSLLCQLWMDCSCDISSFFEEVSSLTPFLLFPSVSLLPVEEGLPVSPCCSLISSRVYLPFLPCLSLLFFPPCL